jgi:hypothetical protein
MRDILLAAVRAGNSRQGIARAAGTGYNWTAWTSVRDSNLLLPLLAKYALSPLAPFIKYWSNPKAAARVITAVLPDGSRQTGV